MDGPKIAGQVQSPSKDKLSKGLLLWPYPLNSGAVSIVSHPFLTSRRLIFLCAQTHWAGEGQQHHLSHLGHPQSPFRKSHGVGVGHGEGKCDSHLSHVQTSDHPPAFQKATDSGVLRGRPGFAGPTPLGFKNRALSPVLFQANKSLTQLL